MNKILNIKWLAYAIILLIFILNIGLYYSHQIPMSTLADDRLLDTLFNADSLFFPALYKDIMLEAGNYHDWYFTPVPYFFPDISLYFLVHYITDDYYDALILFAVVEAFALLIALKYIYSHFFSKEIVLFLTSIIFVALSIFHTPVWLLQFLGGFHYGSFLVGLFLLYILFQILENQKISYIHYLVFAIFGIIIVASDRLFIVHWLLPTLGSLVILLALRLINFKKLLTLSSTIIVIILSGDWLNKRLIPNEHIMQGVNNPKLEIERIPHNIRVIGRIFIDAMENYTTSFILLTIMIILVAIASFIILFKRKKILEKRNGISFIFFTLLIIFMFVGTIFAFSMTTKEINARYFIPHFMLPWIVLPIYISFIFTDIEKFSNRVYGAILSLITVLLLWNIKGELKGKQFYSSYSTPWIKCMDSFIENTGVKYGVAQYWQSKNLYVLSEHNVTMAQYDGSMNRYRWVATTGWYRDRYDFVLIDYAATQPYYKINKNYIIEKNGKPDQILYCDKTEILYYQNGLEI